MMKQLKIEVEGYKIELNLRSNVTVITGDTGSGKTFLYNLIKKSAKRDNVVCIDYDLVKSRETYDLFVTCIKESNFKVIIMDNADEIQAIDDSIMYAINTDSGTNTFIIIGRAPALVYNISDIAEVSICDNVIRLEYLFPEPLI